MKKYFEYLEQEYYALITVNTTNEVRDYPIEQATKIYVEKVGGETIQEVLAEGMPEERTKAQAFERYIRMTAENEDEAKMPLETIINDFDASENEVLIVDGNLL